MNRCTRWGQLSWFTVLAAVGSVTFGSQTATAFDLGIYGTGGFEMVSSQPPPGSQSTVSSPAPTGPSYGVGVNSELVRFAGNLIGIEALVGFGGLSTSWKGEAGKSPSAVAISSMGADLAGRAVFHFGSFRVFGYGGLLYGLFGNSYTTTLDGTAAKPEGEILNYTVQGAMRLSGGAGAGYEIGNFTVDLQGGLSSLSLAVTTPERGSIKATNVTDTYTGMTFGLVASYRLMGGSTPPSDSSGSGSGTKATPKSERPANPASGSQKKPTQKKKKKKKPSKKAPQP